MTSFSQIFAVTGWSALLTLPFAAPASSDTWYVSISGFSWSGEGTAGTRRVYAVRRDRDTCGGLLRPLPLQLFGNPVSQNEDFALERMLADKVIAPEREESTRELYRRFLPEQTTIIEQYDSVKWDSSPEVDAQYAVAIDQTLDANFMAPPTYLKRVSTARLFSGQIVGENFDETWLLKARKPFKKSALPFEGRGLSGLGSATELAEQSELAWEIGGTANVGGDLRLTLQAATRVMARDAAFFGREPEKCFVFVTAMSKKHSQLYERIYKLPWKASASGADIHVHAVSLAELIKRFDGEQFRKEVEWIKALQGAGSDDVGFLRSRAKFLREFGMRSFAFHEGDEYHYWIAAAGKNTLPPGIPADSSIAKAYSRIPIEERWPELRLPRGEKYRIEILDEKRSSFPALFRRLAGIYKSLPKEPWVNLEEVGIYVYLDVGRITDPYLEAGFKEVPAIRERMRSNPYFLGALYRISGGDLLRKFLKRQSDLKMYMTNSFSTDWAIQWKFLNGIER